MANQTPLQYPADIQGKTFIMFAPAVTKKTTDNKSSQSGTSSPNDTKVVNDDNEVSIYLYHPGMAKSNSQLEYDASDTGMAGHAADLVFGASLGDKAADFDWKSMFFGGSAKDITQKRLGEITNPKKSMFFRGVGFREHQFTFDFAPESRAEAETVRKIIIALKKYSHPNITANHLTYPSVWNIKSQLNGVEIQKFKPSYITAINVDLAPDQIISVFESGIPVHVRLEVSFKEDELVLSKDFDNLTTGFGY